MKRICLLLAVLVWSAACTSDESAVGSTTSIVEAATSVSTTEPTEPTTDEVVDEAETTVTTAAAPATTTETIPQTTIDNGAPETSGPVVTDPPPVEEPVPPVELQAYTDEIAVACAKVEFVYLGLRDGFDVDPADLAEGAALAESEDPARYADAAERLIGAAVGERLERADDFLDICADQGYERL